MLGTQKVLSAEATLRNINYYWRLLATGLSFTLFGVGGVVIPALAVPVLYALPGSKADKQIKARKLVHYTFKLFIRFMQGVGILSWETNGLEKLNRRGLLILANHPTLLDVVFLVSLIPNVNCIVKNRLLRNPAMKGFVSLTGYITNDQGEALILGAAQSLSEGSCLLIFPEGTRTRAGAPLSFQRGAANIAVRTPVDITPIRVKCQPATLSKEHRWYNIPERPFKMSFNVEDDIKIEPYLTSNATLAARQLTRDLEQYFTEDAKSDEH